MSEKIPRTVPGAPAVAALVVLGGGATGLAVARNAAALGLRCTLFAAANDIVARTRCAFFQAVDGLDEMQLEARILEQAGRAVPAALVACSDHWLEFLVRHRARLESRFVHILNPSDEVLALLLSKRRFAEWAAANGIPAPRLVDRAQAQRLLGTPSLSFPLLLRPEFSIRLDAPPAPAKAVEVRTVRELAHWLEAFDEARCPVMLTESLLGGAPLRQLSVCVAAHGSGMLSFVAEKLRPHAEQMAVGTYVRLTPHAAAERLACDLLARLRFRGIAEVEILEREGSLYVIEVNARPWSQFALSWRSGRDFLRYLLSANALWGDAHERRAPARQISSGLSWLDFTGDLYMCFSKSVGLVRRGAVSWREYFASMLRPLVFARLSLADPGPFAREMCDFTRRALGGRGKAARREREGAVQARG